MTPARWKQISDLFEATVELPLERRTPFLAQACNGDVQLCEEVETLLQAHENDNSFMTKPAFESADILEILPSEGIPSVSKPNDDIVCEGLVLSGRYQIERKLGSGGVGIVYLARDLQLHSRPVVVKTLLEKSLLDAWVQKQFQQEIEALSRLDHPGIVGVSDMGHMPNGTPYYVMQYVEGHTLRSEIDQGRMSLSRVAQVVRQGGLALSAAHERGILHLDLKPSNIMIQDLGHSEIQVKLIDFGLAKIRSLGLQGASDLTRPGGTLDYMAPEQAMGHASPASDIYALAVIAFELVTGWRLFKAGSVRELLEMQKKPISPRPRELRKEVPSAAEAMLMQSLAFDATGRPAEVRDFAEKLAEALSTEAHSKSRFPSRWVFAATGCLMAAIVWILWHQAFRGRDGDAEKQPSLRRVGRPQRFFARVAPDGEQLAYLDPYTRYLWIDHLRTGESRPLLSEAIDMSFVWSRDSRAIAARIVDLKAGRITRLEIVEVATGVRKVVPAKAAGPLPGVADWSIDGSQLLCISGLPDQQFQLEFLSLIDGSTTSLIVAKGPITGAVLSPDGRFVTYAARRNENWDLYLASIEGQNRVEVRLTDDVRQEMWPLWSPNGESILFCRYGSGTEAGDLWMLSIDTRTGHGKEEPTRLAKLGLSRAPSWSISRTGELFYQTSRELPSRIGFLDLDPFTARPLQEAASWVPEGTSWPSWSNDGRRFYYVSQTHQGLVERDLASRDERVLKVPVGYARSVQWPSPDGTSFAFEGWHEKSDRGIYEYSPKGQTRLVWKTAHSLNPPLGWSPSADRLLAVFYLSQERKQSIQFLERSSGRIKEVTRTSNQPFPRWSIDGKDIAYTDGECLRVIAAAGGRSRQVVCAKPSEVHAKGSYLGVGQLAWSPDGLRIAWTVHNSEAKRVDLWIVDSRTGEHTVWPGEAGYRSTMLSPAWSPDGKQIAFTKNYSQELEEWKFSNFLPAR